MPRRRAWHARRRRPVWRVDELEMTQMTHASHEGTRMSPALVTRPKDSACDVCTSLANPGSQLRSPALAPVTLAAGSCPTSSPTPASIQSPSRSFRHREDGGSKFIHVGTQPHRPVAVVSPEGARTCGRTPESCVRASGWAPFLAVFRRGASVRFAPLCCARSARLTVSHPALLLSGGPAVGRRRRRGSPWGSGRLPLR
jgi:hypothetical protein